MDYKMAMETLRRFRRQAGKVEKAYREVDEAAKRIEDFAYLLPGNRAADGLPAPRMEVYQTASRRWVAALVVSEYASVSSEDALKYLPTEWGETTGDEIPCRLEIGARFEAYHLGLPLYHEGKALNLPPRKIRCRGLDVEVISEVDEYGRLWAVFGDRSGGGCGKSVGTIGEEEIEG